mmetsp:Transcript_114984/g.324950  ORF Transcript_114984/g.324950 Transcript_114984/m.324950 type:complete len:370 (-) Transcript_114984:239-1348(-)
MPQKLMAERLLRAGHSIALPEALLAEHLLGSSHRVAVFQEFLVKCLLGSGYGLALLRGKPLIHGLRELVHLSPDAPFLALTLLPAGFGSLGEALQSQPMDAALRDRDLLGFLQAADEFFFSSPAVFALRSDLGGETTHCPRKGGTDGTVCLTRGTLHFCALLRPSLAGKGLHRTDFSGEPLAELGALRLEGLRKLRAQPPKPCPEELFGLSEAPLRGLSASLRRDSCACVCPRLAGERLRLRCPRPQSSLRLTEQRADASLACEACVSLCGQGPAPLLVATRRFAGLRVRSCGIALRRRDGALDDLLLQPTELHIQARGVQLLVCLRGLAEGHAAPAALPRIALHGNQPQLHPRGNEVAELEPVLPQRQ